MKTFLIYVMLLGSALTLSSQSFTEEEIKIPVADKTVKAMITIPNGSGPFPAVLIIQGSGATDLDGNTMGMQGKNNSLKMLAESLANQGIASLRYNKRIFAGFPENTLSFDDFVTDAVTAFSILKQDNRFSEVGIAGHSQGSLIGMLAAQTTDPDFFISIAGPGQPFDEVIMEQLKANPYNPADLVASAEAIMKKLKAGETESEVPPVLLSLFRPSVQSFIGSWMKYDPKTEIKKLDIPILIVIGTTDIQVTVKDADLLYEASNPQKSTKFIVNGMNHVLKNAPEERNANMATYTNPELPINSIFESKIIGFIKNQIKK
jgi:esterase/lipase